MVNNFPIDDLFPEPFYIYEAMIRYCTAKHPKLRPNQPHPCDVCCFKQGLCSDRYLYASYRRGAFEVTDSLIRYYKGKYQVWIVPSHERADKFSSLREVEAMETFAHDGFQTMIRKREHFMTSTRWLSKVKDSEV